MMLNLENCPDDNQYCSKGIKYSNCKVYLCVSHNQLNPTIRIYKE
jgi:hypothetical protein